MPEYEVRVREVTWKMTIIEAKDQDEAEEKAADMGLDWEAIDGGSWEVVTVEEVGKDAEDENADLP